MKILKYKLLQAYDEDGIPILFDKEMGWNEVNEEVAKTEAYNGEYTVEDAEQEEVSTDADVYDELAAAIREGVNSV